jgi:hypothetical protein
MKISGVPGETRTEHIQGASLESSRHTSLLVALVWGGELY